MKTHKPEQHTVRYQDCMWWLSNGRHSWGPRGGGTLLWKHRLWELFWNAEDILRSHRAMWLPWRQQTLNLWKEMPRGTAIKPTETVCLTYLHKSTIPHHKDVCTKAVSISQIYIYFPPFQLHSVVCVTFQIQPEYALTCLAYICLIPFTSRHVQVLENNLDAENLSHMVASLVQRLVY